MSEHGPEHHSPAREEHAPAAHTPRKKAKAPKIVQHVIEGPVMSVVEPLASPLNILDGLVGMAIGTKRKGHKKGGGSGHGH